MDRALLYREADAAQRLLAFVSVVQIANFNSWSFDSLIFSLPFLA